MIRPLLFLGLALLAATPAHADGRQMEETGTVVLRTIDKLSARAHTFDIPVDKTVKFGTSLFIKARACRKSSPLDTPESAAFLQIWERKPSEQTAHWIFSGWMYGSNPSLSYMDHPVYDVWVIECKNAVTTAKASEEFSSEKVPEHAPAKDSIAPASSDKSAAATTPTAVPLTDKSDGKAADKSDKSPAKPALLKPESHKPAAADPERDLLDKSVSEDDGGDKLDAATAVPTGEIAPDAKPTPAPPIEKLPGSFEDGEDPNNLPAD